METPEFSRWVLAAAVLLASACAAAGGQDVHGSVIESNDEESESKMSQGDLALNDEDFWSDPFRTRDEIEQKLFAGNEEALLVDAPREVAIGKRASIPLVVVRTASFQKMSEVDFELQAVLAGVNLQTGRGYGDLALAPRRRLTAPPEPSLKPAMEGMAGRGFQLDPMARFGLAQQPGEYVFRVILREKASRPLEVALVPGSGTYPDPEVEAFRERERLEAEIPAPWPALGDGRWPSYRDVQGAPAPPDGEGVALSADRLSVIGETKSLVLRGSYRLAVLPQHAIPEPGEEAARRAAWVAGFGEGEERPSAIVPITLVTTGSKMAVPFVWQLWIPAFGALEKGEGGGIATGSFAIDLQQLGQLVTVEQTWFLYALSGRAFAGPVPMAVVEKGSS